MASILGGGGISKIGAIPAASQERVALAGKVDNAGDWTTGRTITVPAGYTASKIGIAIRLQAWNNHATNGSYLRILNGTAGKYWISEEGLTYMKVFTTAAKYFIFGIEAAPGDSILIQQKGNTSTASMANVSVHAYDTTGGEPSPAVVDWTGAIA